MSNNHKIRIFSLDHYLVAPKIELNDICYSHFRGKDVKHVPILRVFGTNNKGEKTCLHIHGVFPYLHIPHSETTTENIQKLCHKIAAGLDKAINIQQGVPESKTVHVHDVMPVTGIPFYGFHKNKHQFLRIRLYNPFNVKRAAQLLCNGAILNTVFQPHDAHVGYELQFMIDYNLHGMKPINLSKVKYRKSETNPLENIADNLILPESIPRVSTMFWEIDCSSDDILNVNDIINGKLTTNPGIEAIWEEERQRRRLQKKSSQNLGPQPSQTRPNVTPTASDLNFRNRLRGKIENLLSNPSSQCSLELNNSVYAAEISDNCDITLNTPEFNLENSIYVENQDKFLDEPVINETLVLSLTQNQMNPTEENETFHIHLDRLSKELLKALGENEGKLIEDDSILSQKNCEDDYDELEDNEENERNPWLDDTILDEAMANINLQLSSSDSNSSTNENHKILQLDGAYDDFLKSNNANTNSTAKMDKNTGSNNKEKYNFIMNQINTKSFKEMNLRSKKYLESKPARKEETKTTQTRPTENKTVAIEPADLMEINNLYYPNYENGSSTSSTLNTPVMSSLQKSTEHIAAVETCPFFFSEKQNNDTKSMDLFESLNELSNNYIDFYTDLTIFSKSQQSIASSQHQDSSKKTIQSIDFEDTNFLIENNFETPNFPVTSPTCSLDLSKAEFAVNEEEIKSLISEMVHAVTPTENNYFVYPHLYTETRLLQKRPLYVETDSGFKGNISTTERYLIAKRVATYTKQLHPEEKVTVPYICSVNEQYKPVSIDLYTDNEFGSCITDHMYSNNLKDILTKNKGLGTIFNCASDNVQAFLKESDTKVVYLNGQLGCCKNAPNNLEKLKSKMKGKHYEPEKFSFALPIQTKSNKCHIKTNERTKHLSKTNELRQNNRMSNKFEKTAMLDYNTNRLKRKIEFDKLVECKQLESENNKSRMDKDNLEKSSIKRNNVSYVLKIKGRKDFQSSKSKLTLSNSKSTHQSTVVNKSNDNSVENDEKLNTFSEHELNAKNVSIKATQLSHKEASTNVKSSGKLKAKVAEKITIEASHVPEIIEKVITDNTYSVANIQNKTWSSFETEKTGKPIETKKYSFSEKKHKDLRHICKENTQRNDPIPKISNKKFTVENRQNKSEIHTNAEVSTEDITRLMPWLGEKATKAYHKDSVFESNKSNIDQIKTKSVDQQKDNKIFTDNKNLACTDSRKTKKNLKLGEEHKKHKESDQVSCSSEKSPIKITIVRQNSTKSKSNLQDSHDNFDWLFTNNSEENSEEKTLSKSTKTYNIDRNKSRSESLNEKHVLFPENNQSLFQKTENTSSALVEIKDKEIDDFSKGGIIGNTCLNQKPKYVESKIKTNESTSVKISDLSSMIPVSKESFVKVLKLNPISSPEEQNGHKTNSKLMIEGNNSQMVSSSDNNLNISSSTRVPTGLAQPEQNGKRQKSNPNILINSKGSIQSPKKQKSSDLEHEKNELVKDKQDLPVCLRKSKRIEKHIMPIIISSEDDDSTFIFDKNKSNPEKNRKLKNSKDNAAVIDSNENIASQSSEKENSFNLTEKGSSKPKKQNERQIQRKLKNVENNLSTTTLDETCITIGNGSKTAFEKQRPNEDQNKDSSFSSKTPFKLSLVSDSTLVKEKDVVNQKETLANNETLIKNTEDKAIKTVASKRKSYETAETFEMTFYQTPSEDNETSATVNDSNNITNNGEAPTKTEDSSKGSIVKNKRSKKTVLSNPEPVNKPAECKSINSEELPKTSSSEAQINLEKTTRSPNRKNKRNNKVEMQESGKSVNESIGKNITAEAVSKPHNVKPCENKTTTSTSLPKTKSPEAHLSLHETNRSSSRNSKKNKIKPQKSVKPVIKIIEIKTVADALPKTSNTEVQSNFDEINSSSIRKMKRNCKPETQESMVESTENTTTEELCQTSSTGICDPEFLSQTSSIEVMDNNTTTLEPLTKTKNSDIHKNTEELRSPVRSSCRNKMKTPESAKFVNEPIKNKTPAEHNTETRHNFEETCKSPTRRSKRNNKVATESVIESTEKSTATELFVKIDNIDMLENKEEVNKSSVRKSRRQSRIETQDFTKSVNSSPENKKNSLSQDNTCLPDIQNNLERTKRQPESTRTRRNSKIVIQPSSNTESGITTVESPLKNVQVELPVNLKNINKTPTKKNKTNKVLPESLNSVYEPPENKTSSIESLPGTSTDSNLEVVKNAGKISRRRNSKKLSLNLDNCSNKSMKNKSSEPIAPIANAESFANKNEEKEILVDSMSLHNTNVKRKRTTKTKIERHVRFEDDIGDDSQPADIQDDKIPEKKTVKDHKSQTPTKSFSELPNTSELSDENNGSNECLESNSNVTNDESFNSVENDNKSEEKHNNSDISDRLKQAMEKREKRKRLEKLKLKRQMKSQQVLAQNLMTQNPIPFMNPYFGLMPWNCPQMPVPANSMNNTGMMPEMPMFPPNFMPSPYFQPTIPPNRNVIKKRKLSLSSSTSENDKPGKKFMCVDGQIDFLDSSDSDSDSDLDLNYKFICIDGKNDEEKKIQKFGPTVKMSRKREKKVLHEHLKRKFHIEKDVLVKISTDELATCDKHDTKFLISEAPSTPKRGKFNSPSKKKSPSKLNGQYAPLDVIQTTSPKRNRKEYNLRQQRRSNRLEMKERELETGGSVNPSLSNTLKENSKLGIITSSQQSLNSKAPDMLSNRSKPYPAENNLQENLNDNNFKTIQSISIPDQETSAIITSTPDTTTVKRRLFKKFQKLTLNISTRTENQMEVSSTETSKSNKKNKNLSLPQSKPKNPKYFTLSPPNVSDKTKLSVSYKYDLERNFFPVATHSKEDSHIFVSNSPSEKSNEEKPENIMEIDNFLDTQYIFDNSQVDSPSQITLNVCNDYNIENNKSVYNAETTKVSSTKTVKTLQKTEENLNLKKNQSDFCQNDTCAEVTGIHYFEDFTDFHLTGDSIQSNSNSSVISKNKTQRDLSNKLADNKVDFQLTPLSNSNSTCSLNSMPDVLNSVQIIPSSPENTDETEILGQYKFQNEKLQLTNENNFQLSALSNLKLSQESITSKTLLRGNDFIVLTPQLRAPTYNEICSTLCQFNIPEIRTENPYYSKAEDAHNTVEVGSKTLKISSKAVSSLPYFQSRLSYETIDQIRQRKFKQLQASQSVKKNLNYLQYFASNRMVVITPSLLPPSYKDALMWVKARQYLGKQKLPQKTKKSIQVFIPASPGIDGNDDQDWSDDCLTLSPCTPKSTQNDTPDKKGSKNVSHNLRISLSKKFATESLSLENSDSNSSVLKALENKEFRNLLENSDSHNNFSCMITGVSPNNTHGFKIALENLQDAKALHEYNYLTMLILEIHAENRSHFQPNPEFDQILSIFYLVYNDVPDDSEIPKTETGIISIGSPNLLANCCLNENIQCICVENEAALFAELVKLVSKWDPDILAGYEIETLSWGYVFQRGFRLDINLSSQISRIPEAKNNTKLDENGKMSELHLVGRIFLDIWRLLRHEIALYSYTFENVIFHTLHERLPKHSFQNLHSWYNQTHLRHITVKYYLNRVSGILKLLDHLDLIGRTCELSKLFGIQFYEVLSRGSQFRVESLMLRLAKPMGFIPVSPSVQQRAHMKAPEFLPLIMEPESKLYNDPIIVLDFQSLYPSIIIGYNYCFSTCLGRVDLLGQEHPFEFGATQLRVNPKTIKYFLDNDLITVSPCGVAFVKSEVREGILPRMLKEILDCRLMVKQSMSENKKDKILQRVLHSRQLGLKLIANVTYGYTAANFSGRMPCIEVGDSVVSKGRETLERAIKMVEDNPNWQAKVVYGDTDSLFVLTPGRSRAEAFRIGSEIAKAVTNDNPTPVKLKLEKIYQPCVLQTKKRYVGYMYESADQEVPEYNAKGIETVRRDGCPAVAKILEKTLRVLFETNDMSQVKKYVLRQFSKILTGRTNIHDLIFAKEYRGFNGYRPNAMVPALALARRYKIQDPMSEPRRKERVPYVIVNGPPGSTLVKLARGPQELLADQTLRPHAFYYITKAIIPPLNRCLLLCGADVFNWFKEMPRKNTIYFPTIEKNASPHKKSTISQHFATASCVSCETRTHSKLCLQCKSQPQKTVLVLTEKIKKWERSVDCINRICSSCCGRFNDTECISLDCPVLYRRHQILRDVDQVPFVRNIIKSMFDY